MDSKHTTEYNHLVAQAEQATSHKEARHLINQSTRIMNNSRTVKPCRFTDDQLTEWISHHQAKIKGYQASINVAEQMIYMMEGIIQNRTEVEEN